MTAHDIADRLDARKLDVVNYLFPAGRILGGEYCVGSLGGEPGRSLKIHLNGKGCVWQDFATGERGGDLLDLWAQARHGGNIADAMHDAAAWLGEASPCSGGTGASPQEQAALGSELHDIPAKHPQLGMASRLYIYHDSAGRPIGAALRWDYPDGSKTVRPFDAVAGEWTFPTPRPLFSLDVLTEHPAAPVVVVEGEPAAEALFTALRADGYVVTTCWGGANSVGAADLSPLVGRRVILWPDADVPGLKYTAALARHLRRLDPTVALLAVEPPAGVREGWDAADAVAEGVDVLALAASAEPISESAETIAEDEDSLDRVLVLAGTLTLADMEANQPEFAIAHLAPCEVTTLFSALGGTGKTLLIVQMLIEAHLGLPIWGCEDFVAGPRTWLYVNTEDGQRWLNRWAAPLLRGFRLDRLPFDLLPLKELEDVPALDARLGQRLARILDRRGHGGIVIDPKIGLMPGSMKIIDSTGLRQFMREGLHPIEKTGAAVILTDHDNRLGQAVAGAVAQQDYARLVLHVIAGEKTDRVRRITLKREKDNTGFPFEEIELERDNVTLVSRVVRTQRTTTDGAQEPCPPDGPERKRALLRLVLDFIAARSDEDARSKDQAVAWMLERAKALWGTGRGKVGREHIRDFLSAHGRWRKKNGQGGGKVLCGVEEVDT